MAEVSCGLIAAKAFASGEGGGERVENLFYVASTWELLSKKAV